jgi:hypothetical protein
MGREESFLSDRPSSRAFPAFLRAFPGKIRRAPPLRLLSHSCLSLFCVPLRRGGKEISPGGEMYLRSATPGLHFGLVWDERGLCCRQDDGDFCVNNPIRV